VPANTRYVADSATLNGNAIGDPAGGGSPLEDGITLYAPENTTPGVMRADPSAAASNVATIAFDVAVDPNLVEGNVISNQAFVSAIGTGVVDAPSDDPRTPVAGDPTRDVVGSLPLLYAEKSAVLAVDLGTPNVVDPGDTLRYTITVYNNGSVEATNVTLADMVPMYTTYVADSTTLNGLAVADAGGVPLENGVPISSADLTPPLPATGLGTLSPGQAATLQFDLIVDAGTAPGTLIINQATVTSVEQAPVLTDGDGNPATGPEPTVVVVGNQQQLAISKQVAVVGGGFPVAGSTLEYTVLVRNVSLLPATYVIISDDLDLPVAGQLHYVDQSATLNGVDAGITVTGNLLTVDYSALYGPLPPNEDIVLRFRATLDANLVTGTSVVNTSVVTWDFPKKFARASVALTVGGVAGSGVITGSAWHDADFDNVRDAGEPWLDVWTVELLRNDTPIFRTTTNEVGAYRISGVPPNYLTSDRYELRFAARGAGPTTALLGLADSPFTNYLQRIDQIVVQPGAVLTDLNLPIDPNGVVYDAMTRAPIAGAVLTLSDAATGAPLPPECFDDPAQQNQITLARGYYKFDLNFSDSACPNGGDYRIGITPPSAAYVAGYSEIIPPSVPAGSGALSVPGCPTTAADAVPATLAYCEAQPSAFAPVTGVPARSTGTSYYVLLTLDDSQPPGSAQIFNNHIPLDPDLADSVSITKETPLLTVTRGQLVPYLITVTNDAGFQLADVSIVDRFPPGFRYVAGSARLDGEPAEPTVGARELAWSNLGLLDAGRHSLELLLAVGSGVSEGDFVNRAQVMHTLTGNALSGEATATVRLMPDPDFDCTDVMGKVFDDVNRNGLQEADEAGVPGVRVVTATGLSATTDAYGRYHITCATIPFEGRGSNFVLKLDDRTLPSGYRSSLEPVRIERATRGKTLRVNFGASIHRVVGLDISDPVFVPGETGLRMQWQPRLDLLLAELRKAPSVLRLSYLADVEEPALVDDRIRAIKKAVLEQWEQAEPPYPLHIETETFWRRGEPPEQPSRRSVKRQ
jgi:large repetitive protein